MRRIVRRRAADSVLYGLNSRVVRSGLPLKLMLQTQVALVSESGAQGRTLRGFRLVKRDGAGEPLSTACPASRPKPGEAAVKFAAARSRHARITACSQQRRRAMGRSAGGRPRMAWRLPPKPLIRGAGALPDEIQISRLVPPGEYESRVQAGHAGGGAAGRAPPVH